MSAELRRRPGFSGNASDFLADASAALADVAEMPPALSRVTALAVPFLGDWCAIDVVGPGGTLRRVASTHVDAARMDLPIEVQRRYPADPSGDVGFPKVFRTGVSELWPEITDEDVVRAAVDADHLDLLRRLEMRSYMCVPLLSSGRVIGTMTFVSTSVARRHGAADLSIAEALAYRASAVVENARLFHEMEDGRKKSALLAEVSRVLAEDGAESSLESVSRLCVPLFADLCTIDIEAAGSRPAMHSYAHLDPESAAVARELRERFPAPADRPSGFLNVIRTGKSELYPQITEEMTRRTATSPEHLALMLKVIPRSSMIVPVKTRERIFGAITFAVTRIDGPCYAPEDLAVAEDLGNRIALALENARLARETDQARRHAVLLAEASRVLATAKDTTESLEAIARLAVPEIGDWCSIDLVDEDGVAWGDSVTSLDDDPIVSSDAGTRIRPPPPAGGAIDTVLKSGRTLVREIREPADLVALSRSDAHLALLRTGGVTAYMIVPVLLRGSPIGVVSFSTKSSASSFGPDQRALAEDFSQRIALALENARLHAGLHAAVRARDELFSVASHELRTPLTALRLMLLSLKNAVDEGRPPEEVARELTGTLGVAERQVSRVTTLVKMLLDVSKVHAGAAFLAPEALDLAILARETVARLEEDRAASGSVLTIAAPEPVIGRWDRFRMEQVLTNLLSNAIKYGEGKSIDVRIARQGAHARIEVQDRGIGMAPHVFQNIFDRYNRGSSGIPGLGLGLYIVKQIVQDAGGAIDVASVPGAGTTFTVEIPLEP